MELKEGIFIAFEGLNFCGKGTQIEKLTEYLYDLSRANTFFRTREPNEFDINGQNARRILKQDGNPYKNAKEAVGYFAKNRETHNGIFIPMLEKGIHVITDRYYESNFAFQGAQGITFEEIAKANKNARTPDLTYIIDVTAKEANRRGEVRDGNNRRKFDSNLEFISKVRKNYLELGKTLSTFMGDNSIVYVNGMQPIEKVWEEIKEIYDKKFL